MSHKRIYVVATYASEPAIKSKRKASLQRNASCATSVALHSAAQNTITSLSRHRVFTVFHPQEFGLFHKIVGRETGSGRARTGGSVGKKHGEITTAGGRPALFAKICHLRQDVSD